MTDFTENMQKQNDKILHNFVSKIIEKNLEIAICNGIRMFKTDIANNKKIGDTELSTFFETNVFNKLNMGSSNNNSKEKNIRSSFYSAFQTIVNDLEVGIIKTGKKVLNKTLFSGLDRNKKNKNDYVPKVPEIIDTKIFMENEKSDSKELVRKGEVIGTSIVNIGKSSASKVSELFSKKSDKLDKVGDSNLVKTVEGGAGEEETREYIPNPGKKDEDSDKILGDMVESMKKILTPDEEIIKGMIRVGFDNVFTKENVLNEFVDSIIYFFADNYSEINIMMIEILSECIHDIYENKEKIDDTEYTKFRDNILRALNKKCNVDYESIVKPENNNTELSE